MHISIVIYFLEYKKYDIILIFFNCFAEYIIHESMCIPKIIIIVHFKSFGVSYFVLLRYYRDMIMSECQLL